MVRSVRKHGLARRAAVWLEQQRLFVGLSRADGTFIVDALAWNPDKLNLQSADASKLLTEALSKLSKQHSLHRYSVRICLDDALCVTRVVTGESDEVEKELEAIQQRSQLYISLGLGEKLTGNLREVTDGNLEYALTSIVNQRTIQSIYNGFSGARLRVEAIEPVTLSVTRSVGLIGTDRDRPIMMISVDENRCDLAITRSGRLMLSYRVSGVSKPHEIANQIGSHMTRLRRFCQRVRSQEGATLDRVLLLGNPELTGPIAEAMHLLKVEMEICDLELPDSLRELSICGAADETILALWAAIQWGEEQTSLLPSPDLLPQLEQLQVRPIRSRIIKSFYPTAIAAGLILAVGAFAIHDYRQLSIIQEQVENASVFATDAEEQLADWESKEHLLQAYRLLRDQSKGLAIDELISAVAPCLPDSSRLESFTFNDDKSISLRGIMIERDETYRMLSSIKRIPGVKHVSLESVNSVGDTKNKLLQFDVRCYLGANQTELASNTTRLNSPPPGIPVSRESMGRSK